MNIPQRRIVPGLVIVLLWTGGCGPAGNGAAHKRPRPVVTTVLSKRQPPAAALVAGSVGSWKTEQIGFEVGGRVQFVVEQNTEIDGRVRDSTGEFITEGTPIARLESERFALQVARAKAEVGIADQNLVAAQVYLNESLPAQIEAAEATETLAKTEKDRSERLVTSNAGAKAKAEQDVANWKSAVAKVRQLKAETNSQLAEIESLKSVVLQSQQILRDAERDLEDCTLYSSFRGHIADTSVVPGSVVKAGEPVVTLQMMDPIKVELEVSAERSRRLRRTDMYPVHVTMSDGSVEIHDGFLFQIDSIADPRTRTYTLTLLIINKRLLPEAAPELATARDVWRLDLKFLPGAENGKLFIEEKSILRDQDGPFLWQVTNATIQGRSPSSSIREVRKIRVTPGPLKVTYLGNLVFQELTVDDENFDPQRNLVIGEITVAEGDPSDWVGDRVVVDSGIRWMLRPGDLVKVDLSRNEAAAGYYVPLDAIARSADESAIFVLDDSGGTSVARRVQVELLDRIQDGATSSLCRIRSVDNASLDGLRCITRGVHYLVDGEPVNAISHAETDR